MHNKLLFFGFFIFLFSTTKIFGQDFSEIQILVESGKFEKAIEKTENIGDEYVCPKNEILAYCYRNLGNHLKSISYYEDYIKNCNPSYIQRVNIGDSYYKTNQLEKAKKQFLIVKKENPVFPIVDYNLGLIEYDSGNKEKAVEYFTYAINSSKQEVLDFDYVEMQIKTLNELEKYDLAFKNIEILLELWDKNMAEYKYTLVIKSSIYGAKREYKTAIELLDKIINSGIDNEIILLEAYAYQLDFYSKMKKKKKACNIYKKIKDINPDTEILKEYECK